MENFNVASVVMDFILDVKDEKISGTYNTTLATVKLMMQIINNSSWTRAQDIIDIIKHQGKMISKALPLNSSVGNMVRRILKIIREEYAAVSRSRQEEVEESLHKILTSGGETDDYKTAIPELKSSIIEHINEFLVELETSSVNISEQASEHIHSNEIIMTYGKSKSVELFLKNASKSRKFEVIVAECSPSNSGQEMAVSLAKHKIQTTVINDSAIFALMSRVNKVIIGTHTVMANGGLRAISGSHVVALAAHHYSVPVIVLAPLYQLSPQFLCSYDQGLFNKFISPEGVLNYSDGDITSKVHVYNPAFDYVPPDLVTLFISNTGGHSPSYVYRLLSELYHPDDYEL